MDYINENKGSYELEYNRGWGNRYPDTRLISYYYNKIRPLMYSKGKECDLKNIGGGGQRR